MLSMYESVSISFRSGRLERELQMVQLSALGAGFAAITLCVNSQRVFVVVIIYFVIESVRKSLDTPSYFLFFRTHIN